ncbi:MAG: hypothetical protein IPN29_06595 [Saprospiraceae bacterium]|nr:hypothetical protein [Saprospiraceae bacterium]
MGNKATTYPIDGYADTNIKRLLYLQLVADGELKGRKPMAGAMTSIRDIKLQLTGATGDSLTDIPQADAAFQKAISGLFPRLNENYSISIMDITPGKPIRYAARKETAGYQPGSVGKLAVLAGFFTELAKIYPNSFESRQNLLCTKSVRAGRWVLTDEHTVSIFDTETKVLKRRTVRASDIFLLYEWLDYMMSVSNNGAAAVCWREAILMRVFGAGYPALKDEEAEAYFRSTPKAELSEIAMNVVNEPLRTLGIGKDEWRLGTVFTNGGSAYIPGKGGSIGTTMGLMKFLVQLERGCIVDEESSLEMKRLFYMTDRRIRYAASPTLKDAAVYFKSGSLYQCRPEAGYYCAKYKGNFNNYMNSVAIVEHPDKTIYMVALMSNVRKRNSATDHMALASAIDKKVREK